MQHEDRERFLGHRSPHPRPGRKANVFLLLVGLVPLLAMAGLVLARWLLYGVWPWK